MATRTILASIPDKPDPGRPGYFAFPNQLGHDCGKIGAAPILVYVVLAIHAGQDGRCWPSLSRIAGITRMSERTVRRAIRKLVRTGWVKETFRPGNSTLYHVRRADMRAPAPPVLVGTPEHPEQEPIKKANGVPIGPANF